MPINWSTIPAWPGCHRFQLGAQCDTQAGDSGSLKVPADLAEVLRNHFVARFPHCGVDVNALQELPQGLPPTTHIQAAFLIEVLNLTE